MHSKASQSMEPKAKRQKKDKNFHDDLIYQLIDSSYRPKIGESSMRFADKQSNSRESYFRVRGHHIFKCIYMKSQSVIPKCNTWRLGLAILFIPNVFLKVDFIKSLARCYNVEGRYVRFMNGRLLGINRDTILEVFGLEDCRDCNTYINLENLKAKYDATEVFFRRKWLPIHRPRYKDNLQKFVKNEQPPYKVDLFCRYFELTYYAICQVLGYNGDSIIPKELLFLVCDVQGETDYKCYDYPQFVANALHESLVGIQ